MQFQSSVIIGLVGEPNGQEQLRVVEHTALEKARLERELSAWRESGQPVIIYSNDEAFLERVADEVWWIRRGHPEVKGHPREVLDQYRHWVAAEVRSWGRGQSASLAPTLRRGDGRARLLSIETLGADGAATLTWSSGENVAIRVKVQFEADVPEPVVGIMLRTRIGMEVYGTNSELERLQLGPVKAGETRVVRFEFPCLLCPQEYTVTAASHDPDGVWHDWMEDAVAIRVTDARYTAGVANLRAKLRLE
jgi:lipopolysaccharide transport system ATP-binding protein